MRFGGWVACGLVCSWFVMTTGGCVALEKYQRLETAKRMCEAQREQLTADLEDERSVADSLRTRVDSSERELGTNNELLANYRTENDLLSEMLKASQAEIGRIGSGQKLTDITIAGPKLPEQLDAAIKNFARVHAGDVVYDSRNGTVKWKSDLVFAIGSDVVIGASKQSLAAFADVLKSSAASGFEVLIVGHTDNKRITSGTAIKHPTNWHLSTHRAIAVMNVLLENGYAAGRIGVAGCGEYRPVASNAAESGATQNRRVEIYLVPIGSVIPASVQGG